MPQCTLLLTRIPELVLCIAVTTVINVSAGAGRVKLINTNTTNTTSRHSFDTLVTGMVLCSSKIGHLALSLANFAPLFLKCGKREFVSSNSNRFKGRFQKRFRGIRPLRGGGVPPFSAKEKNLLFFRLIFR